MMETDGLEAPFRFEVALTVGGGAGGGGIVVDFSGTSMQQKRAVNCPLTYTNAMTFYALKCALLPDLPNNDGMYRPIRVVAPERCLLNPLFPAAVGARSVTGHYVPVLVFGALHQLLPGRVMAAPGSPLWNLTITGEHGVGNERFTSALFFNGGLGARPDRDGAPCLSWPSNISCTPVEIAERNGPLLFLHKRLSAGSGGEGRFRGGLGQEIAIAVEADGGASAHFMVERTRFGAPGLEGGGTGMPGGVRINGVEVDGRMPRNVEAGDVIEITTPGGGGYGEAGLRDPGSVMRDRVMGYVARE